VLAPESGVKPLKILFDTDAGVDDILALFVLFELFPETPIDVAVSFGNVARDQALRNVGLFLELSGVSPRRTFRGRAAPIRGEPQFATDVHGADGIGGVTPNRYGEARPPDTSDLADCGSLASYDRVIAVGPLTDMAALQPGDVPLPPLFVMGGAFDVAGNITPFAEFNFHSDPLAARQVFDRYPGDVFVVPLDVCNRVVLRRDRLDDLCDRYRSRTTAFLRDIHDHYMRFYQAVEGIDGCHPHDALAVVAAFFREAFVWTRGRVRVVADGPECGRSLFTADEAGSHFVARATIAEMFFEKLEAAMARHVARRTSGPR
jgi:inosine-uridine nucleoside N-ribohydrolase